MIDLKTYWDGDYWNKPHAPTSLGQSDARPPNEGEGVPPQLYQWRCKCGVAGSGEGTLGNAHEAFEKHLLATES